MATTLIVKVHSDYPGDKLYYVMAVSVYLVTEVVILAVASLVVSKRLD